MISEWDDPKPVGLGFGVHEDHVVVVIDQDQWLISVEEGIDLIKGLTTCCYMAWAARSAKNN